MLGIGYVFPNHDSNMTLEGFWNDLLPRPDDSKQLENVTIDVMSKGCFDNYNTLACVRNGTLTALGILTFFLSVYRIVRLHILQHTQIHQYLIFYGASIECVLLTVKWLIGKQYPQLEFSATILQLFQFVLLCHFQWTLVTRILHYEKLNKWIVIPVLVLCFLCFMAIAILGIISPKSTWIECLEPQWLLLSIVAFFVVQLFMIAGIYITRKINSVSALESFKKQQKIDLWSVIFAYESSATVSLGHDISINLLGNEHIGCSGIYDHEQIIYSPIFAIYVIIKYLLPIWALVIFYRPTRGYVSSEEERILGWSGDGSTRSTFSPVSRKQLIYKQLYASHREQNLSSSYPVPVLKRSQTSPAFFSSPRINHPVLASISEECSSHVTVSAQDVSINEQLLPENAFNNLELSGESDEILIKI